ncbi:MAG: hypothetical protein J5990_02420 [Bacteroidales bacterium]|nr:hypothetical protein [Bacteroidales bacterium]
MCFIEGNNVLVNTDDFRIGDININVYVFIRVLDTIFNPYSFSTVAESNDFASVILLQDHPAQETVNISVDDDVLVLVKNL